MSLKVLPSMANAHHLTYSRCGSACHWHMAYTFFTIQYGGRRHRRDD